MNGSLIDVDGRPALHFERTLPHPVARVWRAVTEPAELAQWFVGPVAWTPALGETFEDEEHRKFGQEGFEGMVERVALLEKTLGIYDLRQFTPR